MQVFKWFIPNLSTLPAALPPETVRKAGRYLALRGRTGRITEMGEAGGGALKRLYGIVNQKQVEHGARVVGRFFRTEKETEEPFQERCTTARNAFVTTIRVTAGNGEVVTGHGEGFFDSQLMPERIVSITLDTGFSPAAILKYTPTDRATVFFDFSKPPLLDLSGQPSAPTPNNSNFFILSETEAWSTSLRTRLSEFLGAVRGVVEIEGDVISGFRNKPDSAVRRRWRLRHGAE